MPTQMNFEKGPGYRAAPYRKSEVTHAQTNFDGGKTTKEGGTNKSRGQMNYEDTASFAAKEPKSYFGEKKGTGSQGGY
jgi:hypothetical protein